MWKLLNKAIPTGDFLNHHYLISRQLCVSGCSEGESITHLFLTCPLSKAIWFRSMSIHSINLVDGEFSRKLKNLISLFIQKDQHRDLIKIFVLVSLIWEKRNKAIHEGTLTLPEAIIREIEQSYIPHWCLLQVKHQHLLQFSHFNGHLKMVGIYCAWKRNIKQNMVLKLWFSGTN